MHTSTRLASTDFQYWQHTGQEAAKISFADFCPQYHELDRVGVVSPCLADGILHTGRTLLALTTAFYDCQRARSSDFFDYPQHFAFVGTAYGNAGEVDVQTAPRLRAPNVPATWDAWGWLDVWPGNKWITAPPTATGLLQRVFDFQINRLFWPQELLPAAGEPALPAYAYQMLRTRLKSVYFYTTATFDQAHGSVIEVRAASVANKLWQESIGKLPGTDQNPQPLPQTDRLQRVDIDDFLNTLNPTKS